MCKIHSPCFSQWSQPFVLAKFLDLLRKNSCLVLAVTQEMEIACPIYYWKPRGEIESLRIYRRRQMKKLSRVWEYSIGGSWYVMSSFHKLFFRWSILWCLWNQEHWTEDHMYLGPSFLEFNLTLGTKKVELEGHRSNRIPTCKSSLKISGISLCVSLCREGRRHYFAEWRT